MKLNKLRDKIHKNALKKGGRYSGKKTPKYSKKYLDRLIAKVGDKFDGIDADEFVREIRGID